MIANIATEPNPPVVQPVSIETLRLSLTPVQASDLDAVVAIFGDAHAARMTHAVPHPLPRDAAQAKLEGMMAAGHCHWAIRLDDVMIGVVSLTGSACGRAADFNTFGPHLSVFVAPGQRGHGYAVEAIDGLLRWVKRKRLHKIVHAAHFADNLSSARVLITADFLYTGRRTQETSMAREGRHEALHMVRIL